MLSNLGALTEIAALGDAAELTRAPGHMVVRSRSAPGHYWGNFVLLDRAPTADGVPRAIDTFRAAFADDPRVRHVAIGWQDAADDAAAVRAFADRGYLIDDCTVTALTEPPPDPALPRGLTIARATTDADWRATVELAVAARDPRYAEAAYTAYQRSLVPGRRREAAAGRLRWYLARIDDRVVGDMGLAIVRQPPPGLTVDRLGVELPVARFQAVKTHPDFRGRGVCSALLATVCREALGPLAINRLVLHADVEGPAWRIYRRHGFRPVDRWRGAWRPPTADWVTDPGPR